MNWSRRFPSRWQEIEIEPAAAPPVKPLPRIVIIGAGFGGLQAARALNRSAAEITLLDRENHHTFQPLLYQVATAALSPADIAWPIRSILRRQKNVRVLMGEVTRIDTQARVVHAGALQLPYDFLVIATGATHSYFGHEEWAAHAPGLKSLADATRIRRDVLIAFEKAELTAVEADWIPLLTFVIVGAGPTGVEMAGAIAEVARDALRADFREIDPGKARIVLIEAGPRILAAFPENLSSYARRSLEHMGVEVLVDTRVVECDRSGVQLEHGRIDAQTIIWAAGVVASPAADWLRAAHDRAGRILVGPHLEVPGLDGVYAVGDTVSVQGPDGWAVPGVAPAAKQMGAYVGQVLAERIAGRRALPPFRYRHEGDLATVGRRAAVVKLGRLELTGFIGWVFWGVAHIYFLVELRTRIFVALSWLWSYVTFQRGARLIVRPMGDD